MEQMLTAELTEIHEYVRHILLVYVTWFSFFLTLLLTAMAWSLKASLSPKGEVVRPAPFFCIVTLFTIQLILAIVATSYIIDDFDRASARVGTLLALYNDSNPDVLREVASPMPKGIRTAYSLMRLTLYTNLFFWLAIAFVVFNRRGKRLLGYGAA
jgi:hypothetical protein